MAKRMVTVVVEGVTKFDDMPFSYELEGELADDFSGPCGLPTVTVTAKILTTKHGWVERTNRYPLLGRSLLGLAKVLGAKTATVSARDLRG